MLNSVPLSAKASTKIICYIHWIKSLQCALALLLALSHHPCWSLAKTLHWLLANLTDGQPSMMQAVDFWQHSDQRIKGKKMQCNADTKHHQEFQRLSYVTLYSRITVIVRVILFDCHEFLHFPRSSKFSSI